MGGGSGASDRRGGGGAGAGAGAGGVSGGGGGGDPHRGVVFSGRGGGGGGGENKALSGIKFTLVGFNTEYEEHLKVALQNAGAAHALFHGTELSCTHLIVSTENIDHYHPMCDLGRRSDCHVLNDIWVRDTIQLGRPASASKDRYRPKMRLPGVIGADKLIICCQGYGEQFVKIEDVAKLIGAKLYTEIRPETTHYMSYKHEGPEYKNAIKQGLSIVNQRWLYCCLSDWSICPLKRNIESDYLLDSQRRVKFNVNQFSTPPSKAPSTNTNGVRKCKTQEVNKHSSHRTRDPESASKKFLDFDIEKLSGYASSRRKLVECILCPASVIAIELTKPFVKCILSNSYIQLVQNQCTNRSLAGHLTAENFYISLASGFVEIKDFVPAPSSESNCKADRLSFVMMVRGLFDGDVPPDVEVWLKGITEGWNNNVLCNLVNMGHPHNGYACFQPIYHCLLKMKKHHPEEHADLLELLGAYDTWKNDKFNWLTLEENKTYYNFKRRSENDYAPDVQGLLANFRDSFEHPAKAYATAFLDVLLGEFPSLLADIQCALYDKKLLPELDFKAPSAERINRRCRSPGGNKSPSQMAELEPPTDCSLMDYASEREKLIDPAVLDGTELTEPFFKAFLNRCYVQLVRHNQGRRSLAGNVLAQNFWYSEICSSVEMRGIQTVPSSSRYCRKDRNSFVEMVRKLFGNNTPIDVALWLQGISDGWEDNIMCHFITMAHPDNAYGQFQVLYHVMIHLEKLEPHTYDAVLKAMEGHNQWKSCTVSEGEEGHRIAKYYRSNIQGFLTKFRDYFESQRKDEPCADDFLDTILAEHPRLLCILQKVLYDMKLLPQLDWRTAR